MSYYYADRVNGKVVVGGQYTNRTCPDCGSANVKGTSSTAQHAADQFHSCSDCGGLFPHEKLNVTPRSQD